MVSAIIDTERITNNLIHYMKKFPDNFLWGAATSAHQIEGDAHNNWSQWEKRNAQKWVDSAKEQWEPWQQEKFPEIFTKENYISGVASDHYDRYEEDLDLAKDGGHNAHRFGIDWARIEPKEGQFDTEAIEHYQNVVRAIRERGMEPFVTLWHWTHPLWLEERGGVLAKDFPERFAHYAHIMAEAFGSDVTYYATLNEPTSYIAGGYGTGKWPPGKKNVFLMLRAYTKLADAHKCAYRAIHKQCDGVEVGFTNIMWRFKPYRATIFHKAFVRVAYYYTNEKFLRMTQGYNDYLSLQYYFSVTLAFSGIIKEKDPTLVTDLGWRIDPTGIYEILMFLKKFDLPIYLTEDGLADRDDTKREKFIRDNLAQVHRAIEDGANVRGYFHWSLTDNFEWDKGFWPRFGLIEVDFKTLKRIPRKSFWMYKEIIQKNATL